MTMSEYRAGFWGGESILELRWWHWTTLWIYQKQLGYTLWIGNIYGMWFKFPLNYKKEPNENSWIEKHNNWIKWKQNIDKQN